MNDLGMQVTPEMMGEGVYFERIRRITGYLVGTLGRFNSAKRAEESERVKHGVSNLNMVEALADNIVESSVLDKIAS